VAEQGRLKQTKTQNPKTPKPQNPVEAYSKNNSASGILESLTISKSNIGGPMAIKRTFIPNQVFIGLPWKTVRPRYERIIDRLATKFPVHFTIVGRDDGQDAEDLFEVIKARIASSSFAIFDATGGNANVSLEYGYAEALNIPRAIYMSTHKAAKATAGAPIISDLGGKRRNQYKTESVLSAHLHAFCRGHNYTIRFEKFLVKASRGLSKGAKKSQRTLALKIIHIFDGEDELRRDDAIQRIQAKGYENFEIENLIKLLHSANLINITTGRYASVRVA
jgi:hypothetical protein